MSAYYNEFDPYAAQWLRNLIAAGHIAPGDVDDRSILDVKADDLKGYTQCHFFAGIGGWSLALRLAGWADDRPVWTGSCPCQPLSVAGKQRGHADERHIWPAFYSLIAQRRPAKVFGEQVASKVGREWLSGIRADMEGARYAVGAADLCAAGVRAPHVRQRLWWFADATSHGQERLQRSTAAQIPEDGTFEALDPWHSASNPFQHWKEFLAESNVSRVADGVSSGLDIRPRLHAYGNAIVPQLAAEFILAAMEL